MKIIAFNFVIKHKAKKFNFVDAFLKRFNYQSIDIKITKLLFIFPKKLNMVNSLNVNVISKIRALCAVISRNFYLNNVSFEIEFLKNWKNEIFKFILSFIKKIENHDVIFDVLRVIADILTNNEKKFENFVFKIYI